MRTCTPASPRAGTASAWSSRPPTRPGSPRSPSPTRSARTPPGCPRSPTPSAEVEVVRADGWLAWPTDLSSIEAVSVAVSRLPLGDEPLASRDVRALLATGDVTPETVAETLITATINGIERASRYAPAQLARPLNLLTQVGLDDAVLTPELLGALATVCRETGTIVEISEAWRSPSPRIVALLRDAGVALVPASDARYAAEVGRWQYLHRV